MGLYTPEFKELISDEAKILVEDSGKIVKTNFPKAGATNGLDFAIFDDATFSDNGYFLTVGTHEAIVDKLLQGLPIFGLVYGYYDPETDTSSYTPYSLILAVDYDGEFINIRSMDNKEQYEGIFSIDMDNNVDYGIPELPPPV